MKRNLTILTILLAFSVALAGAAQAHDGEPIGDAVKELPIFDAHIHYKTAAWTPYPPGTVIELMDKSGVAMALVSSSPDQGTIRLWEFAPNRIVPELRPYHGSAGSSNWTHAEGMLDYLKRRLAKYPHKGIGEFHIHNLDTSNKDLLKEVAALAAENKILIHVHSGAAPVSFLYQLQPDLTIIWAHAGMSEPPSVILPLMDKHETLYADMSFREGDVLSGSGLDPQWKALLLRHMDRFMVGSDTWVNGQWAVYEGLIQSNRDWLRYMPRNAAEMIAYKNAERLFGVRVSRDLIGKR